MIDRQGGKLIFECDCCDATFERDDGFNAIWNAAKAEGWKARKVGKEWVHACQDCEIDR